MSHTIGKYYKSTLAEIQSGNSQWVLKPPTAAMDQLTLQAGIDTLTSQINAWNEKILASTKPKEMANLGKIIEIQQKQLDQYTAELLSRSGLPAEPETQSTGTGTDPGTNQPAASQGSKVLPWLLIAAGIFIIRKL